MSQDFSSVGRNIKKYRRARKMSQADLADAAGLTGNYIGMVERDEYCTDILVQVAAVNAALNSFNKVLLANHIKTCVTNDIREGKEETVDELVATLQKLMK